MKLTIYPDRNLETKTEPVTVFDEALGTQLDEMVALMRQTQGCGLSANQAGKTNRVCVVQPAGPDSVVEMINPEILSKKGTTKMVEGCLSFPGVSEWITRPGEVKVQWQDRTGSIVVETFTGIYASMVQHELDHLDGKTFLDLMSPLKLKFVLKDYRKALMYLRAAYQHQQQQEAAIGVPEGAEDLPAEPSLPVDVDRSVPVDL